MIVVYVAYSNDSFDPIMVREQTEVRIHDVFKHGDVFMEVVDLEVIGDLKVVASCSVNLLIRPNETIAEDDTCDHC